MRGGEDVTINTLYRFFAAARRHPAAGAFGSSACTCCSSSARAWRRRSHGTTPRAAKRDAVLPELRAAGPAAVAGLPDRPRDARGACCPTARASRAWSGSSATKANPLAPAYPGIKPEWYFLWIYQLLKEFPPHLFGFEGPAGGLLLVVSLLMGFWALMPWLDRAVEPGGPRPRSPTSASPRSSSSPSSRSRRGTSAASSGSHRVAGPRGNGLGLLPHRPVRRRDRRRADEPWPTSSGGSSSPARRWCRCC